LQIIWDEFLKIIKEEAGSQVVETWFKTVSLEKWDSSNKEATLKTPNQFVSNWIQEHYTKLLKIHLARLLHTNEVNLLFSSKTTKKGSQIKNIIPASTIKQVPFNPLNQKTQSFQIIKTQTKNFPSVAKVIKQKNFSSQCNLNENYQFNNFVIGPNNSLAHAAAYAICENLGKVYNPLFIYGGTGLGKTHLLHALGNTVKKLNPKNIVCYVSSDRFINEFINAIRFDRSHQFRAKYQKIDLLLLDDIQFLSNKEQTQEMFFHIFNTLYEQKKQIVLSSDTFPKEIKGLQDRLRSRIEWGLVADIQVPDLETKIAILKKKADLQQISLPDDVSDFIAFRIQSNIRELEGALIRVSAFSSLTHQPISLEMAQKVLLNLKEPEKKKEGVFLEKILKITSRYYSVSIHDVKSKKRHKNISTVRQIIFYLMKKLGFCSLQTIGNYVGGRDHSTVIHAIGKIKNKLKKDANFAQKLKKLEQDILTS
jgi:chromosomal replication initiator protein